MRSLLEQLQQKQAQNEVLSINLMELRSKSAGSGDGERLR